MSKKNNPLLIIGAVICLSVASTMTAFAGWEQTGTTWKYNFNGTYFNNGWNWIDGNNDGISECYYFNTDGTILISTTTPDNYMVNENGAWVVNGVVQTRPVEAQQVTEKGLASIPTDTATSTSNQSQPTNNNQDNSNQNQNSENNKNTGERHYDLGGLPDPSNYDPSDIGGVSGIQSEVRTN